MCSRLVRFRTAFMLWWVYSLFRNHFSFTHLFLRDPFSITRATWRPLPRFQLLGRDGAAGCYQRGVFPVFHLKGVCEGLANPVNRNPMSWSWFAASGAGALPTPPPLPPNPPPIGAAPQEQAQPGGHGRNDYPAWGGAANHHDQGSQRGGEQQQRQHPQLSRGTFGCNCCEYLVGPYGGPPLLDKMFQFNRNHPKVALSNLVSNIAASAAAMLTADFVSFLADWKDRRRSEQNTSEKSPYCFTRRSCSAHMTRSSRRTSRHAAVPRRVV